MTTRVREKKPAEVRTEVGNGGWKLTYRTESPKDLEGVFWRIEVWVKGADALVCELKGGKGGLRSNGCYSLSEVSQ